MKQAHRSEQDPAVHTACPGSGGRCLFSQNPRLHLGPVHSVENGRHTGLRPLALPTGLSDTWADTFRLWPVRHRLQTQSVVPSHGRLFLSDRVLPRPRPSCQSLSGQWLLAPGRSSASLGPGLGDLLPTLLPCLLHQKNLHGQLCISSVAFIITPFRPVNSAL